MFDLANTQKRVVHTRWQYDWQTDLPRIREVINSAFEANDILEGFFPHPDEEALQSSLLGISALRSLRERLLAEHPKAVIIEGLGLAGMPRQDRNLLLYAISLASGFPTATEPRKRRIFWDVRDRSADSRPQGSDFITFSERTGRADMHTDSSFSPRPEEHFMLYVVRAARCGGGASCLVDVDDVLAMLTDTRSGRSALQTLTAHIPFRVPGAFANRDDSAEVGMYPVFSSFPDGTHAIGMRWRHDAIIKGLEARPELASSELRSAIALVHDLVENSVHCDLHALNDDSLLWVDNHRMLHGRTDFQDPDRHLIRIRVAEAPHARRGCQTGLADD